MDVATSVSSPAVTRSLNLEFDAEIPSGYERGPLNTKVTRVGPSSQIMGLSQSLSTLAITTVTSSAAHGGSLSTSSPMFTPTVGPRNYYY
ncbi:hypothetical protein Hanom_Chr11g00978491 [Helianthus anomalus]